MNLLLRSLCLFSLLCSVELYAGDPRPAPQTYTYKKVRALEIKADVYQPASAGAKRPVVVYMHGGSLINGHRQAIENHRMLPALLAAGCVVVSIDYRLAPETKLPAQIEDLEDAFRWVREQGPALFGADPNRIAASGGSAGGYLALVAGYRVKPRPKVIFAEMSYGDLIGAWQLAPSVHQPHYTDSHLTEAEAWKQVAGAPIANDRDRHGDGSAFNDFIRRTAQWPKTISGWDPRTEAEKYLPYLPLRNVTRDYPPTILVHGESDSDVPVSQPQAMLAELQRNGVESKLIVLPGTEHGFRGGDPAVTAAARDEAVRFILKHL
jgi:acetyl esterase/lipase